MTEQRSPLLDGHNGFQSVVVKIVVPLKIYRVDPMPVASVDLICDGHLIGLLVVLRVDLDVEISF